MDVIFNRKTIISFPNNPNIDDVEEGIAEGSLLVDEVLFPERFTVGTSNSNRFECELYNFPTISKGEKIYVYQLVDETEGEDPVEVPLFTGYVDSCITNRGRFEDSKSITAYDALYVMKENDVAEWWEDVFDGVTTVKLKTLRESLLTYVDIPFTSTTLPNDDVDIPQTQQLNTINFNSMLTYILNINAVNAHIDRSGYIQFFTTTGNTVDITDVYAQNTTEFDTYIVPPYLAVRIVDTTNGVTIEVGDEQNYFDITDNLLLIGMSEETLLSIAQNVLTNISSVTYKPAQIDMIYSQLDVHVGDIVKIGNNNYLVCENVFSGSMFVDQRLSSLGANAFAEQPADYDASKEEMQKKIQASSLKYYRFQNERAITVGNNTSKPIITIKYTCTSLGVIIFHGCALIDVNVIDTTQPATVTTRYMVNNEFVREYAPVETYYRDGKHTLHFLHFWDFASGRIDRFKVYLECENCSVLIGAFAEEGYMEGMGLLGETTWDGTIDLEDTAERYAIKKDMTVKPFSTTITSTLTAPQESEIEDNAPKLGIKKNMTVKAMSDTVLMNKKYMINETWAQLAEKTWAELNDDYIWG